MRRSWGDDSGGRYYEGGRWLPFNWQSIPVTRTLLFATVATFLLFFFTGQSSGPIGTWIPFVSQAWYLRPWTWFTYPFLELPSFWILITLYVLYSMGGMLERSWASANFAALFFAFTGVGALGFVPAYYLLGKPVVLVGLSLPLVALITAWAAMEPELEVSFWGIIVKAKFLAAVWVALIYFQMGMAYDPITALFSLAAPAAAFFYVRKLPRLNLDVRFRPARREPLLREDRPRRERPPRESVPGQNPLRRRQEREEMERLRRLLGDDDDPPLRH